jgi:hypothetical protein
MLGVNDPALTPVLVFRLKPRRCCGKQKRREGD